MRPLQFITAIFLTLCTGLANAQEPLAVEILTGRAQSRSVEYQLAGSIEAPDTYSASFRDGGRIVLVRVDAGDFVTQGAEIARVDTTQAEAAAQAAQAALTGAEAGLTESAIAHDRVLSRLTSGVATRMELEAATQALAAAQSQRDQAAAQVSKANRALDDTVLRAPQSAIVTARHAEVGQITGPGQAVVELASDQRREAVFDVPDVINVDAYIGKDITLTLIDDANTVLQARLTEVSPVVDAATGTVRVRAAIQSLPPGDTLLGAPVLGHIAILQPPTIHLPWTALTATAAGPAVWTVDPADMTVHLTQVVIEGFGADEISLASGITPGQMVVGAGSQLLYPGRIVRDAKVSQ